MTQGQSALKNALTFLPSGVVVFRIGAHHSEESTDPTRRTVPAQQGGILGLSNMSRRSASRFTIFALGISPNISSRHHAALTAVSH